MKEPATSSNSSINKNLAAAREKREKHENSAGENEHDNLMKLRPETNLSVSEEETAKIMKSNQTTPEINPTTSHLSEEIICTAPLTASPEFGLSMNSPPPGSSGSMSPADLGGFLSQNDTLLTGSSLAGVEKMQFMSASSPFQEKKVTQKFSEEISKGPTGLGPSDDVRMGDEFDSSRNGHKSPSSVEICEGGVDFEG